MARRETGAERRKGMRRGNEEWGEKVTAQLHNTTYWINFPFPVICNNSNKSVRKNWQQYLILESLQKQMKNKIELEHFLENHDSYH